MDSNRDRRPLIVGAGPVGKAAALFLARAGYMPRIIDAAPQPSTQSRALAVNPRTLELLEPTGITAKMLRLGIPVRGAQFWRDDRALAEVTFEGLQHKYPFMLALSQATTERLLEESLHEAGVSVEREVGLARFQDSEGGVRASLQPAAGGDEETVEAPWLLAADGAHSVARRQLGLAFPGSSFAEPWYLADVPLRTTLAEDRAHIVLLGGGGFLFLMRVVRDKAAERDGAPLWRVMGTMPDPLARLAHGEAAGEPVWTSNFHVVHRIVERLQVGNVYLAGDAAHLHSPVGARGMNLGIEDSFVLSELARADRLAEYSAMRHPVDWKVVKRVEMVSRMARGKSLATRAMRRVAIGYLTRVPFIRHQLMRTVTGLDHTLEFSAETKAKTRTEQEHSGATPTACTHNPFLGAGS